VSKVSLLNKNRNLFFFRLNLILKSRNVIQSEQRIDSFIFRENISMSMCRYYMQGTCRFGNQCKFLHSNDNGPRHHHGTSWLFVCLLNLCYLV